MRAIRNEQEKVKRSLKQAAAKGDRETCTILAKEIVNSRKATNRIYMSKAHLNSIQLQMKNQLATLRVAGSLEKSTEVMQAMQNLVRLPEIANVMREMSKEMMKAGIIEEMLDETMESVDESEELEEEVQSEVDKVWPMSSFLFFIIDILMFLFLLFFACRFYMRSPKENWAYWNRCQRHQLAQAKKPHPNPKKKKRKKRI